LPTLFPLSAEDFPLDPSYEPQSGNADSNKVAVFKDLQRFNRIHLVVPVGAVHMYYAAIDSKACRLTASGLYYWRLAKYLRI
jgi:hypothetical protein